MYVKVLAVVKVKECSNHNEGLPATCNYVTYTTVFQLFVFFFPVVVFPLFYLLSVMDFYVSLQKVSLSMIFFP